MRRFLAALGFLTIFPLPASLTIGREDHGGSAAYYPLIGLGIGAFLAAMYWLIGATLPLLPKTALLVAAMALVSGGLHMDGLADTFDGLMSHKPRERALEIMRDSRLGAMGGLAMALVLLTKFSCLAAMDGDVTAWALLLAATAGRSAMSLAIVSFPYARAEGLGAPMAGRAGWGTAASALLVTGLAGAVTGLIVLTIAGFFMWAAMALWTAMFGFYCKRRLGGMTGDTYGALCETTETLVLLIVAGYIYGE